MGLLLDRGGVRLMLLMGKTVPLPAPSEVVEALAQVQVTRDAGGRDGFSLTFNVGKDKTLEYALLNAFSTALMNRVIIAAVIGVSVPEVLIDGIITMQQHSPSREPGASTFTVTGTDLTTMLDLKEKNASYPNQPDFIIVTTLLLNYAMFGLVPKILPTTDIPIETDKIPRQAETDLKFIRRMAQRNGYIFFIEPVTLLVNQAYFGPDTRLGLPQAALSLDSGSNSNVTSMSFSQDALAPVGPDGDYFLALAKTDLPIPTLPSLKLPPFALNPTPISRTTILRDAGNKSPAEVLNAALATVSTSPDSVTGNAQVDTAKYGGIVKPRLPIGVRGVGLSYDGLYYVRKVSHKIDVRKFTYTQDVSLSREGTGSLVPVVAPS
jgi:hypothetical protein